MALTQVTGPYPIFTDLDGTPLDDGYLYIGAINDDPETNPIQVFFDANLTIPATQPIRTSNGYAYRNGTPALLYTGGEFSITIRNKRNEFVLYSPVGYGFDPAAVSASVVKNDFVGDGVEVDFTLSAAPSTILATNVFINGVYQEKDSYNLLGNVITFSIAPPLNSSIEVMTNETGVINSGNATAISYTATFAGATAQTVQTKLEQYVSVKDFGAVGDGVADDTVAIQDALDTGHDVFVPLGDYIITSTLRYSASGQTMYGENASTFTDLPQCNLIWDTNGGTMLSFAGVSEGHSNCKLSNIRLNGNNKADVGVDVPGSYAAYRCSFERVFFEFINYTANATAIDLGSGSFPNFAHDTIVKDCYIGGCNIGVKGNGAIHQFISTTWKGTATDRFVMAGAGAAFSFVNCVFSDGAWQIQANNSQLMNFTGCWFEDSNTGIYLATTANTVNFNGCYLQTSNTTRLMDWGNAAGQSSIIGCYVPGTSGSTLIKNVNGTYGYTVVGSNVEIEPGYRQRVIGFVRNDNGAFAAGLLNDAVNLTGDGTNYSFNSLAWNQEYDLASAFNAATGVFTAPLFGYYEFKVQLALDNLAVGHTEGLLSLVVGGTTYQLNLGNYGAMRTSSNNLTQQGTVTVYMVPNDTAYIQLRISNSTKSVGVLSGNATAGSSWRTRFEGRMI
jgi:hypothetical protein